MPITRREVAMRIIPGDNFKGAADETKHLLRTSLSKLKWLQRMGTQHVIAQRYQRNRTVYYLVTSDADLQALCGTAAVVGNHVTGVIGSVEVDHGDLDDIDIVWINKEWQGKGYGEGMHRLAYLHSKHGIRSSTNIGTMELKTLIRLYVKEPKIELIYDDMPMARKGVEIKGTDIWVGKLNLCHKDTEEFYFEWRK